MQLGPGGESCVDVAAKYLENAALLDHRLNSLLHIAEREALMERAADLDRLSDRGPLHCVPVVLKDNIDTSQMPTSGGSVSFSGCRPPEADADVVVSLERAGALLLAKANLDEFALGYQTQSSAGGQTRNAFDTLRYPGGSSGGTAVAVAAGIAVVGLGTDTGGSVRIPAGFSSLFGLRPTQGLISTKGVVPLSHSRDTVGPMARRASDLALVLDAVTGADGKFERCSRPGSLRGVRIGLLRTFFSGADSEDDARASERAQVAAALEPMLRRLSDAGAMIYDPNEAEGGGTINARLKAVSRSLINFKSSSNWEFGEDLARYLEGRRSDGAHSTCPRSLGDVIGLLGGESGESDERSKRTRSKRRPPSKRGLKRLLSTLKKRAKLTVKSKGYATAATLAPKQLRSALDAAFESGLDLLLYPTFTRLPSLISRTETQAFCSNNRISAMSGYPALTIPGAAVKVKGRRLPVGLELLGRSLDECLLLRVAGGLDAIAMRQGGTNAGLHIPPPT